MYARGFCEASGILIPHFAGIVGASLDGEMFWNCTRWGEVIRVGQRELVGNVM